MGAVYYKGIQGVEGGRWTGKGEGGGGRGRGGRTGDAGDDRRTLVSVGAAPPRSTVTHKLKENHFILMYYICEISPYNVKQLLH